MLYKNKKPLKDYESVLTLKYRDEVSQTVREVNNIILLSSILSLVIRAYLPSFLLKMFHVTLQ